MGYEIIIGIIAGMGVTSYVSCKAYDSFKSYTVRMEDSKKEIVDRIHSLESVMDKFEQIDWSSERREILTINTVMLGSYSLEKIKGLKAGKLRSVSKKVYNKMNEHMVRSINENDVMFRGTQNVQNITESQIQQQDNLAIFDFDSLDQVNNKELSRRWKIKIKEHHPDKNIENSEKATIQTQKINKAYAELKKTISK